MIQSGVICYFIFV